MGSQGIVSAPPPLRLERDDFVLQESDEFGWLRLQVFHRQPQIVDKVSSLLGSSLPPPGSCVAVDQCWIFWCAPGEWLFGVPAGHESEVLASVQSKLLDVFALMTTVTDSQAVFGVSGKGARDILARGSTVNFLPSAFSQGDCVVTRFAKVPVMLAQTSGTQTLLIACRSHASYLFEWLEAVSCDCGTVRQSIDTSTNAHDTIVNNSVEMAN